MNRPHPWGLLITFIELIKNPAFKFWSHDFVHCAPEIEKYVALKDEPGGVSCDGRSCLLSPFDRLFQSVAQCCMGQKQAQQVMEGTGAS